MSNTLSGGESQRINLTTALGSSLVGSLYILDEPSIGLHSRDTNLDVGPDAGRLGGEIVFEGTVADGAVSGSDDNIAENNNRSYTFCWVLP